MLDVFVERVSARAHRNDSQRCCYFGFSFLSRKVLSRTVISLLLFLAASTLSPHWLKNIATITQFSHQNKSVLFISMFHEFLLCLFNDFDYINFLFFSMLGNTGKYLRIFTKQTAVISLVCCLV